MTDLLSPAHLGLFFLRPGPGVVFVAHGYPKMTGRGDNEKGGREPLTQQSIAQLGLFFPYAFAILVGAIEFYGGLLLILGLQSQGAVLALAMVMLVASARNLRQKSFFRSADLPFCLLMALLSLARLGSGKMSLEGLIFSFG